MYLQGISSYLELLMHTAHKVALVRLHNIQCDIQYWSLPQTGKSIACFDPSFLPWVHLSLRDIKVLKGIPRFVLYAICCIDDSLFLICLKGRNLLDCDLLVFPIHKPLHCSLVVGKSCWVLFIIIFLLLLVLQIVYPQTCAILGIDSLHNSDEDAVNWIWLAH